MNSIQLRTLKLLEEIDRNGTSSQRDLAKVLNISLGLVNLTIKQLVQKGYFTITTTSTNRATYHLTAKGMAEKSRLAYESMKFSFEFYKSTKKKLQTLFQSLIRKGVQRMVFYGAGDLAEIAYISLQETPIEMVAVVDDDQSGQRFLGYPILSTSCLTSLLYDRVLITKTDTATQGFNILLRQRISSEKLILLS